MSLKARLMQDPHIEIVGEATNNVEILLNVGCTRAEVAAIDLPLSGEESGLCSHLLAEYPDVKVFALSEGGDRVVIYETGVLRREVPNTSLENLTNLIRRSMRSMDSRDAIRQLPS
jgi:DNA-binding NarL/FixJ family response regulator